MKILGVDGGLTGGLAVVLLEDGCAPVLVAACDVPVIGTDSKRRVDALGVRSFILEHQPQHIILENAQPMPRQGVSSIFRYARAIGAIEGVIATCEIPVTIVAPATWKKYHGLRGSDKELSRQRALQLFPSAHALLSRKRDHGRSEAALMALVPVVGGVR